MFMQLFLNTIHNESEFHTKGREKLEEHHKHDVEWEESDTNNTH